MADVPAFPAIDTTILPASVAFFTASSTAFTDGPPQTLRFKILAFGYASRIPDACAECGHPVTIPAPGTPALAPQILIARIFASQAIPATPLPLWPLAATMPATCVP